MPLKPQVSSDQVSPTKPKYVEIVKFLVQPLLESASSLKVDCENTKGNQIVWIRLAFDDSDKGRVFGRGGRNIEAVRSVLEAAGQLVGQSIYLDVYGSNSHSSERGSRPSSRHNGRKPSPSRVARPRSKPRPQKSIN